MDVITQFEPVRVMLWTTPRCLGTVMCKCLSFVPGMQLFYEPFLAAYQVGPERRNHGTPNEHVYERYFDIVQQEMQAALENNPALFADTNWFDHEYCIFDSVCLTQT